MYLQLPLSINNSTLKREEKTETSINAFLSLLLSTPCNSCVADPDFGFVFNNLRFEIFDENEGVVFDSFNEKHDSNNYEDLYVKKISGTSKNLNTFAVELKKVIEKYEKRLTQIAVSMTYVRDERKIYVNVKGYIPELEKDYQYISHIKIWH